MKLIYSEFWYSFFFEQMLVHFVILAVSLWPDAVDDSCGSPVDQSLSTCSKEEQEDGQWNVTAPVLKSVDVALSACFNEGSDVHGAPPVAEHVEWENSDERHPPV